MTVEHGDSASVDSNDRVELESVAGMHGSANGSKSKYNRTPQRLEEGCMAWIHLVS